MQHMDDWSSGQTCPPQLVKQDTPWKGTFIAFTMADTWFSLWSPMVFEHFSLWTITIMAPSPLVAFLKEHGAEATAVHFCKNWTLPVKNVHWCMPLEETKKEKSNLVIPKKNMKQIQPILIKVRLSKPKPELEALGSLLYQSQRHYSK